MEKGESDTVEACSAEVSPGVEIERATSPTDSAHGAVEDGTKAKAATRGMHTHDGASRGHTTDSLVRNKSEEGKEIESVEVDCKEADKEAEVRGRRSARGDTQCSLRTHVSQNNAPPHCSLNT